MTFVGTRCDGMRQAALVAWGLLAGWAGTPRRWRPPPRVARYSRLRRVRTAARVAAPRVRRGVEGAGGSSAYWAVPTLVTVP